MAFFNLDKSMGSARRPDISPEFSEFYFCTKHNIQQKLLYAMVRQRYVCDQLLVTRLVTVTDLSYFGQVKCNNQIYVNVP